MNTVGPRAERRPSPRVGVTLAGIGSALIVFAALAESGNRLGDGDTSPNRFPGIFISALVVSVGYFLVVRFKQGPAATAGVAASALGVPPLMFFASLDFDRSPPFSITAVLFVSSAVWLVSYFAGPTRGHGFYLGLALFGVWLFVLEQVEGVFSFPFGLFDFFGISVEGTDGFSGVYRRGPDTTNLGVISLCFGVGYFVAGRMLDKREQRGLATPFALAGVVTTYWGIAFVADELKEIGTGIAFIVAGIVIAGLGALAERRATTWIGGLGVFIGAFVLAGKIAGDNVDAFAAALALLGAAAILIGYLTHAAWGEPDELEPGPSTFSIKPVAARPPSEPTPF